MKASHHIHVRALLLLLKHLDGLTTKQVADLLDKPQSSIRECLKSMNDAYIDRWVKERYGYSAVWCAVPVPEDCPKPSSKAK